MTNEKKYGIMSRRKRKIPLYLFQRGVTVMTFAYQSHSHENYDSQLLIALLNDEQGLIVLRLNKIAEKVSRYKF